MFGWGGGRQNYLSHPGYQMEVSGQLQASAALRPGKERLYEAR
jgi:hypothetical protein